MIREGVFCDVFACDLGIGWVYQLASDPRVLVCELLGREVFRATSPSQLRYPRCAASPTGQIVIVGQGEEGLLVGGGWLDGRVDLWRVDGPCYSQPAIARNGNEFVIAVQTAVDRWARITQSGVRTDYAIPVWPGGDGTTSGGIRQIVYRDGREEILWADAVRWRTLGGETITAGVEAGGYVFGQVGEIFGVAKADGSEPAAMAAPIGPMDPRAAYDPRTGLYAIGSVLEHGRCFFDGVRPPWLPLPALPTSVPSFGRWVWEGPFHAAIGAADLYPVTPGNCEMLTRADFSRLAVKRPVVADMSVVATVPDEYLLAIWCGFEGGVVTAATEADYRAALAMARTRRVPLVVYWDGDDYPDAILDRFVSGPDLIPGFRAYPAAKPFGAPLVATPAEDLARIRAVVTRLAVRYPRILLARTCYTQSGNYPWSHVLAMQPGITQLVRDTPQVWADLWFAWSRDPEHAIAGKPELQAYVTALAAAVTGERPPVLLDDAPAPVPIDPPASTPDPTPDPPRPEPPVSPWPLARRLEEIIMTVGLRVHGKALGVEPGTDRVYADRDRVGGWEELDLQFRDGGAKDASGKPLEVSLRFLAADRQLCQRPDGGFEARPAGQIGGWETFFATRQPDGSLLAYRFEAGVLVQPVLQIEAR